MDQQQNNHGGGNVHLSHSPSPQPRNHDEDLSPTNLGLGISNTNTNDFPFNSNQFIQSNNTLLFNDNQGQGVQFTQADLNQAIYASSQGQDFQGSFQQQLNSDNGQFFTNDFLNTNNFGQSGFNSFGDNSQMTADMNNMNMNANMGQNMNQNLMPNMNQNMNQDMSQNMNEFDTSMFLNEVATQNAGQSVNPADLGIVNQSSPNYQSPSPPMLQGHSSNVTSAQHSPAIPQPSQFGPSRGHSRNASLQPETANFPNAQMPADWTQYRGSHRRTPSESGYSDVSASSAAPSPNLGLHDNFDDHRTSPMLHAQQDPTVYQDLRGLNQFSISEPQMQATSPFHGRSPAHSPIPSPRINAQQMPLPDLNQASPFSLTMGIPPQPVTHHSAPNVFQGMGAIKYERNDSSEMGQAQQMPPPDINIEFAPASRQNSFEPPKPVPLDQDALTPPQRGRRPRASSDVTFSRQSTPGLSPGLSSARGSSPHSARSLSPMDRLSAASPGHRRRHSTSATPSAPAGQRDYMLALADPEHQPLAGSDASKPRAQKHPATFQCTLCPKRFTRAYNLRSHLRTHTDERPFVCTVCGKAFARQHDRKRHEGLHSGEKKFVCKGDLRQGGHWGCARRFARADALGRHFRSEAGRICIKPLLDEEQLDRQRQWQEQHFAANLQMPMQAQPQFGQPGAPGMDLQGNYALPARLIEQYPALANLTWSDMPAQGGYDDDISGRSSFDASGSEYFDEGDEGGYVSGPGVGFGPGQMNEHGFPGGYASDYGGR